MESFGRHHDRHAPGRYDAARLMPAKADAPRIVHAINVLTTALVHADEPRVLSKRQYKSAEKRCRRCRRGI